MASKLLFLMCSLLLAGCTVPDLLTAGAVDLADDAIHAVDIRQKAKLIIGAPVSQCDELLGMPLETFHEESPNRQWRLYDGGSSLLHRYSYVVKVKDGHATAIGKARGSSNIVVGALVDDYFAIDVLSDQYFDLDVQGHHVRRL